MCFFLISASAVHKTLFRDYSIYKEEKTLLFCKSKIEFSLRFLLFSSFHSFTGGASYSPEYYINIRTGIHYFPKGNTTIDASSNRFKSGLNRIEEKLDEVKRKLFQLFVPQFFSCFIVCAIFNVTLCEKLLRELFTIEEN